MASHPDVVITKLVSKRVTYVHRKLWPAIVAVGSARQNWQLSGLSPTARELLALVDKTGRIRTDGIRIKRSLKKEKCRRCCARIGSEASRAQPRDPYRKRNSCESLGDLAGLDRRGWVSKKEDASGGCQEKIGESTCRP